MLSFLRKKDSSCASWVLLAKAAAEKYKIDPVLFVSLVLNESSGDIFATRWERRFYVRYISDRPLAQLTRNVVRELDTYQEATFRHCLAYSWGLCQVMGVVAYEYGFTGRHCWELLEPKINLDIGAQVFAAKRSKVRTSEPKLSDEQVERKALLAYNGGGDVEYPDRVYKRKAAAVELLKRCG